MPDYRAATRRAAEKYGVNPAILEALIQQESGFNPRARSGAGAQGIAQFMPGTAPGYGVNLHDNRVTDDLEGAAKYIAANLKRTGGNYAQALSIYNSGKPDAYKDPNFAGGQTYNYVKTILGNAKQFGGTGGTQSAYAPPSSRTTTRTVGAVDNSQGRKNLAAQFLLGGANAQGQHNTTDVLGLALAAQGLKDQPGHQVTTTTTGASPSGASPSAGGSFAKAHSPLLELIHNTGSGPGFAVKNGQKVNGPQFYGSVWAGHTNHVHLAAGPKTVVELGKLAQQMGLSVGENSHFGGVHPVHAPDSYHYKNEAIDVSGDPQKMNQFAAKVQRLYNIR